MDPIHKAIPAICNILVLVSRIYSEVLYKAGNNGAAIHNAAPIIMETIKVNTIIFLSVSTASSSFPAPNFCPTIMEIELLVEHTRNVNDNDFNHDIKLAPAWVRKILIAR